jgi:glycosyltransferase involved in cell wall biosynthesis
MSPRVVIAHDALVQRGGAERVVLAMHEAFPDAPIVTALYEPARTYPEFAELDIRPLVTNRVALFRADHRKAFPVLAAAWSATHADADVVVCSSAGWSHGIRTNGRKLVYCHTPARWLYPFARVADDIGSFTRAVSHRVAPAFRAWDRRAAGSADRYLANSTVVQQRIAGVYGIEAGLLHPPVTLDSGGATRPVAGLDPGFVLVVSRLLGYKNVGVVIDAARRLPTRQLVVVGSGPMRDRLSADLPPNVTMLGAVTDAQLRWLYDRCRLLVAAGFEDFGLTPLEAAAAGRPTVAIRWGGYFDTVVDGETGLLADEPRVGPLSEAIESALTRPWDEASLRAHAARFGQDSFVAELRAEVDRLAGGHEALDTDENETDQHEIERRGRNT